MDGDCARVSRVGCVKQHQEPSNKQQTTRTTWIKMDGGQPCALKRWVAGNNSVAESSPAALIRSSRCLAGDMPMMGFPESFGVFASPEQRQAAMRKSRFSRRFRYLIKSSDRIIL